MAGRKPGTQGKRASWALLKPMQPDALLSEITGSLPLPLSEHIKRLWAYIQRHGLQDVNSRAIINADEKLRAIFNGKIRVTMFEMFDLVSSHVLPAV
jgi:upstream activation factor subunit UAF30